MILVTDPDDENFTAIQMPVRSPELPRALARHRARRIDQEKVPHKTRKKGKGWI